MTDLRGIQRYDIEFTSQVSHSEYRDMVEGELGDWVKYDDVAKALSSSEALVKELATELDNCEFADNSGQEYLPKCPSCGGGTHKNGCRLRELLDRPEVRRILDGK